MNPIGDRGLGTIGAWLDGLARRREAVAQNIANIDTPGYQRREVDFEAELRRAYGTGAARMTSTHPGHVSLAPTGGSSIGSTGAQELTSSRLDGNTVDIDQEMIDLAETQMRYQAATTALNKKLASLREVLRSL